MYGSHLDSADDCAWPRAIILFSFFFLKKKKRAERVCGDPGPRLLHAHTRVDFRSRGDFFGSFFFSYLLEESSATTKASEHHKREKGGLPPFYLSSC